MSKPQAVNTPVIHPGVQALSEVSKSSWTMNEGSKCNWLGEPPPQDQVASITGLALPLCRKALEVSLISESLLHCSWAVSLQKGGDGEKTRAKTTKRKENTLPSSVLHITSNTSEVIMIISCSQTLFLLPFLFVCFKGEATPTCLYNA